ncbi:MAG: penicillin-binding protein 2 [Parcubacteria group bacterium]|nr:MAG: penicillin-binding protein 2 [Parcubacteria group bacterium]
MKNNPFKIQEGTIRDADVSGFIRHRQSGDYLNFDYLGRAAHLGKFFNALKLRHFFIFFMLICGLLIGRSFYLQVISGGHYRTLAEGNRISKEIIPANRGLIYDRFGDQLVKNVSYFFLYLRSDVMPSDNPSREAILDKIATILGIKKDDLYPKLNKNIGSTSEVLIYENIAYEPAIKLMVLAEEEPALRVSFEPRRLYFPQYGLAHVIGYLGAVTPEDVAAKPEYNIIDRIGKTGIEYIYENYLRGQDGQRQYEVDALFHKKDVISLEEPKNGQDITLTIDSKAQQKLYDIMLADSKVSGKSKMSAIVANPKTGEILALANLPSYDNNVFTNTLEPEKYQGIVSDPNMPMLNRAISGTYPLGSVFKLVMAAAALQEKIINKDFKVHSVGGIEVGGHFFPDWRPQGHGWADIYWALADSVNTFFYSIGGGNNEWLSNGLGVDKIIEYAKKFGFSRESGIDLPSEASGFLPSKEWKEKSMGERWYLGDTYNLSIGQGFLAVTPLQALDLVSYFANRGITFQPHLLKEVGHGENKHDLQPKVSLTNLISSDNLNIVRESLRLTVTEGTAQSLQSVLVPVAGKTGTAQFRSDKTPHSWFASFAPYDEPQISMIVLVEEGGDTGLAVRITREFMEWYFSK